MLYVIVKEKKTNNMGIHCDKCGHYITGVERVYSESELRHAKFMLDLEINHYAKAALKNPELIECWEEGKREIAKDLTVLDCNTQHIFLDDIKEKVEELEKEK